MPSSSRTLTFAPYSTLTRNLSFAFALLACLTLHVWMESPARAQTAQTPPTVELAANTNVITICPRDASQATPQVRLTANTRGFTSGNPLRYRYNVSGGRIIGDGANTIWDLSGVTPGTYTANVEVDNGTGPGCMAFTSTAIVVRECPPPIIRCPVVRVICPENLEEDAPVIFTANVSGGDPAITPTYTWTLSAGTILSGQGTDTITIDRRGVAGQTVTATVQIGGYDQTCAATATCSLAFTPLPETRRFDEFPSIAFDDDKARLDNLAIELQNSPGAQGYIFIYAGDRGRPGQVERLIGRTRNYLVTTRGIDATRLVIVNGGTRRGANPTFELYIVPPGATPPVARP